MGKFTEYIGSQFGNPRGIVGKICCIIMNVINNKMYIKTVQMISLPEKSRVLDIGYGNGYLLKLLDKSGKKYELYGIDISEDMKKKASKKNDKAFREGRLHLETGDCCALSYENEFFSAVTSINTVYFWSDISKGMSEIYRTLTQNGTFYNVVYTKEWLDKLSYTKKGFKKYDAKILEKLSREAGFSDVEVHDIVKGRSFVVVCRKN